MESNGNLRRSMATNVGRVAAHGATNMTANIIISKRGRKSTDIDSAVELQLDRVVRIKKSNNITGEESSSEISDDAKTNYKFERKLYLVSFDSVKVLLGLGSQDTFNYLKSIRANGWDVDGIRRYALDEVLSSLAGR